MCAAFHYVWQQIVQWNMEYDMQAIKLCRRHTKRAKMLGRVGLCLWKVSLKGEQMGVSVPLCQWAKTHTQTFKEKGPRRKGAHLLEKGGAAGHKCYCGSCANLFVCRYHFPPPIAHRPPPIAHRPSPISFVPDSRTKAQKQNDSQRKRSAKGEKAQCQRKSSRRTRSRRKVS